MIPTRNFDHIHSPRRRVMAYVVQGLGQLLEWILVRILDRPEHHGEEEHVSEPPSSPVSPSKARSQ